MKFWRGNTALARAVGGLVAFACAAGAWPSPSLAQEAPWEFAVSPYLWVSGIKAKSSPRDVTSHHLDVKYLDLVKHLDGVPFVGAGEIRKGRFGVVTDLLYMPLASRIDTRNVLFNDGKTKLSIAMWETVGFYRVADGADIKADVGAGFRLWSVSSKTTLNAGLLPAASTKLDKTFVDPVLAVRASLFLSERWSVTGYVDMGGFDVSSSKLTWQLMGTVNYRAADWVDLRLGWRHMAVERSKITLDLTGPIFSAMFRF